MSEMNGQVGYLINQLGKEIKRKLIADPNDRKNRNLPQYQNIQGHRISMTEFEKQGLDESQIVGAIRISYVKDKYMIIDRIIRGKNGFKKKRRLHYYLDTKSGQIGSTLLLEMLKLEDGQRFSKHKFVRKVEMKYFLDNEIRIQRSEINEVLSRMLRKTLSHFFGIEGRHFRKEEFYLHIDEIELNIPNPNIERYKHKINQKTNDFIRSINALVE